MFFNGLLIGVIGAACQQYGMSLDLWSFVAPHGSLELPSIVLRAERGSGWARGCCFQAGGATRLRWPARRPRA